MAGKTMKQFARDEFWSALDDYKKALASGNGAAIIVASLRIHQARGADGVPKSWSRYVTAAWREATQPGAQPDQAANSPQ